MNRRVAVCWVASALLVVWTTTAAAQGTSLRLRDGWDFSKGDVAGAEKPAPPAGTWSRVTVPHTWNVADAYSRDFYRGVGWYRRSVVVPPAWAGKRIFIRFEGAGRVADVFVDGRRVGNHAGAFAAFAFELTPLVTPGRAHLLAVRVTNEHSEEVPPISGDFNIFGGLYRDVTLFARDPVCITPLDSASPGVYLAQTSVTAARAEVTLTTKVSNGTGNSVAVEVVAIVSDARGTAVTTSRTAGQVGPGAVTPLVQTVAVERPHLWDGVRDPYLYSAAIELRAGGRLVDRITQPLGLREFRIDPQQGAFLNGRPYRIRGVNRHQDRDGLGWAITERAQDEDMAILLEMGVNGVRLAHYQHSDYFYSLCDRKGLVVWAENALVNEVRATGAFRDTTQQQLVELIRQNFNHPSIVMWSLANEIGLRTKEDPASLIQLLQDTAKAEDPTRPTVAASSQRDLEQWKASVRIPDLVAANLYPGWYSGEPGALGGLLDRFNAEFGSKGLALSEYGAGASPSHHEAGMARRPEPGGRWHPEEWQAIQHEISYEAVKARPFVWGSFVWVMFDFASASRQEGERDGVNDKGLVTVDRAIRKDAYYFYKANWNPEPMAYVTSRRHAIRTEAATDVKVYSNCPRLELTVNGRSMGVAAPKNDVRVFVWPGITLSPGANTIEVSGRAGGKTVSDRVVWTLKPGAAPLDRR